MATIWTVTGGFAATMRGVAAFGALVVLSCAGSAASAQVETRDLPIESGKARPNVVAKWTANAPLAFVDQYIADLRRYRAIAIDIGDRDGLRFNVRKLHEILDAYGVVNSFGIYPGTHTSNVALRLQNHVTPFFSAHLQFSAKR